PRRGRGQASLAQLIEVRQVREYFIRRGAEVEEAGNLVHARGAQRLDELEAALRRADEGARGAEALVEELHELVELALGERVDVDVLAAAVREPGHQSFARLEVVAERLLG